MTNLGFDEPQLGIMYIDKRLRGANVVQTLGRLNRIAPVKILFLLHAFHRLLD